MITDLADRVKYENGNLYWRIQPSRNAKEGALAQCLDGKAYNQAAIQYFGEFIRQKEFE